MRIQGRMQFFKKMSQKALNRILTLPDYRSRREILESSGIIDFENKTISVVTKHWNYRISVPMLYIAFVYFKIHKKTWPLNPRPHANFHLDHLKSSISIKHVLDLDLRFWNLPELSILKTKTYPWWQNTENIEFRSQCHILSFYRYNMNCCWTYSSPAKLFDVDVVGGVFISFALIT